MILPNGLGLGIPHQNAENESGYFRWALETFAPDCWLNWKYDIGGKKYFPMLWKSQWAVSQKQAIVRSKSAQTDKSWFLCNEPERESQSNTTPEAAVRQIRYWKRNIGMPFAAPGILWGQTGRDWWAEYRRHKGPTPDAYHIHIYAYNATSWTSQLEDALRTFDDRPLIISECGGWGLFPMMQAEIMEQAWKAVYERELIPAAFWFSSHYGSFKTYWQSTDCHDRDRRLTSVGNTFRQIVRRSANQTYAPIVMA